MAAQASTRTADPPDNPPRQPKLTVKGMRQPTAAALACETIPARAAAADRPAIITEA